MRVDTVQLRRVTNAMTSGTGRRAARKLVFATITPQEFLTRSSPEVVVDVGANRGQFVLDVRAAAPSARVIAFEPLPDEFSILQSIHGRASNVDLRQRALASTNGRAPMHVSAAADSSSLLPIANLQSRTFPGTHEIGQIDVDVSTLDDELSTEHVPPNSLLKLDVQGGELDVLQGGLGSLHRFRYVLVEASFVTLYEGQPLARDVIAFLGRNGFGLKEIIHLSTQGGRASQADFVFEAS